MSDFIILMKQEWIVTAILFLLLILKLRSQDETEGSSDKNESLLYLMNILLVINLASGFFFNKSGTLFGDMFRTNALTVLEKNLLNLGTLIISLQSYSWLRLHKHVAEFYMLL